MSRQFRKEYGIGLTTQVCLIAIYMVSFATFGLWELKWFYVAVAVALHIWISFRVSDLQRASQRISLSAIFSLQIVVAIELLGRTYLPGLVKGTKADSLEHLSNLLLLSGLGFFALWVTVEVFSMIRSRIRRRS
jgi:hypothetical protein